MNQKPYPIFIPRGNRCQKSLTPLIEDTVNRIDDTLKTTSNNTIKITTSKFEQHRNVINMLKNKKVEFHTCKPRHQRYVRVQGYGICAAH